MTTKAFNRFMDLAMNATVLVDEATFQNKPIKQNTSKKMVVYFGQQNERAAVNWSIVLYIGITGLSILSLCSQDDFNARYTVTYHPQLDRIDIAPIKNTRAINDHISRYVLKFIADAQMFSARSKIYINHDGVIREWHPLGIWERANDVSANLIKMHTLIRRTVNSNYPL